MKDNILIVNKLKIFFFQFNFNLSNYQVGYAILNLIYSNPFLLNHQRIYEEIF